MLDQATARLTRPEFEREVRDNLATWPDADPGMIERTVTWVRHMREDLLALLKAVEDEDQIRETLAINYIELKTRWIALNTKVNYQTFRTGACDPEVAFRGSACSCLLAEVETLLQREEIEQIAAFLAQPVRRAA